MSDKVVAMPEKIKEPHPKRIAFAKTTSIRVASTLNAAQLAGLLAGNKEKRVSGRAHEQLISGRR